MRQPPPRLVRRFVLAPVVFVGAVVFSLLLPLIHVVAALMDLLFDRKRWRFSRFIGLGLAFCVVEAFGLFAAFTTWLGSGFGVFMHRPFWSRAHAVLVGQWLELITRAIRFFLGFTFEMSHEPVSAGPQLVFSRHAGPGDALLLARIVVREHRRRLHMVGATKLQWDPFLDIMGERIGFHYLASHPGDPDLDLRSIRDLAASLDDDESLVIFPEGGNYTPRRRETYIQALERRGRHEYALRAVSLRHTLAPKPGAVRAAMEGAPHATVVFVAHVGLEGIYSMADLWRAIPLRRRSRAHAWPASLLDRPNGYSEHTNWLYRHWTAVDEWIAAALGETLGDRSAPGERAAPAVAELGGWIPPGMRRENVSSS